MFRAPLLDGKLKMIDILIMTCGLSCQYCAAR